MRPGKWLRAQRLEAIETTRVKVVAKLGRRLREARMKKGLILRESER